jgi:hypothetical protein
MAAVAWGDVMIAPDCAPALISDARLSSLFSSRAVLDTAGFRGLRRRSISAGRYSLLKRRHLTTSIVMPYKHKYDLGRVAGLSHGLPVRRMIHLHLDWAQFADAWPYGAGVPGDDDVCRSMFRRADTAGTGRTTGSRSVEKRLLDQTRACI